MVVAALVEGAELTDEILLSLVGVLGVSAMFCYRAIEGR